MIQRAPAACAVGALRATGPSVPNGLPPEGEQCADAKFRSPPVDVGIVVIEAVPQVEAVVRRHAERAPEPVPEVCRYEVDDLVPLRAARRVRVESPVPHLGPEGATVHTGGGMQPQSRPEIVAPPREAGILRTHRRHDREVRCSTVSKLTRSDMRHRLRSVTAYAMSPTS